MSKRNLIYRSFIFFLCFALVNIAVPQSLVLAVGQPLASAIAARQKAAAEQKKALDARKAVSRTRLLSEKELRTLEGRTATCPYIAGTNKWDPSFQGVDLVSGNYSLSATDLSFDGGFGIPVNITRSYSANDANEGPFGYGWTLSADVRTTAGGLLKSKGAPVLSVPTTYKERSPLETDPNIAVQPVDAVVAEDASGKQETIQKDADGVLSAAAWDQNVTTTQYQNILVGTSVYQVATSQTTVTPDGTTYVYQVEGSYTNGGTYPYGNPSAGSTPANVLKCVSATDRYGNTTTYSYDLVNYVTFNKIDGTTSEHPLLSVKMPNGHVITLIWGTGATVPTNRVASVSDNALGGGQSPRTVTYTYSSQFPHQLISQTSPAGLATSYGYAAPVNNYNSDTTPLVLSSITNPQGLTTQIQSFVGLADVMPYNAHVEGILVNEIILPSGVTTVYNWAINQGYQIEGFAAPDGSNFSGSYAQHAGGISAPLISTYFNYMTLSGSSITVNQCYNSLYTSTPVPNQVDTYDVFSQANLYSARYTMPAADPNGTNLYLSRKLSYSPFAYEGTQTATTYNFLGNPLDVWVYEVEAPTSGGVNTLRSAETSYAYWDATKFYQQKAVKDPGGRISFTDYYTATDSNLGNRGQKYRVYDPKYGGVALNSNIIPPAGTQTGDAWRYQVYATAGQYSGQFTYDSQGRPLTVLKLQAATAGNPSTYRYVTTQTSYSSEPYVITSPDASWGQATQVVEDYGGINRTTRNMAYTSWGKPCNVIDGAGHQFVTGFDGDGKVLYVTLNGNNVVTYTYGATGTISSGMPTSVVDNLSGVEQDISYQASGPGIGQPGAVVEKRGGNTAIDNQCLYAYGPSGDRSMATYCSGLYNGNGSPVVLAQWGYFDYIGLGDPSKGAHAFQTLCKLDGSGNRTSEEFHYAYDAQGRLYEATFAQTPSNLTPDANGYYDGYEAATRARAHYEYDGAGRLTWLGHYWDTLGTGNTYTSQAIVGQYCDYESNGMNSLNRGVKTDAVYKTATTPGSASWTTSHTDTYVYDAQLDYLTAASYGDGLANASPTWSYDAAGNRNDAVTDNLNRATSLGGTTVTNDILGNRITEGSKSYGWDILNRMTSFTSSSGVTNYVYRADGMRVSKSNSMGSTSYRYDGQMGMEDIDFASNGTVSKVTDYGIGPRGIDAMYVTQSGATSVNYPLYDAHGNMISTLNKQGTGGYAYSALRTFDAWGLIRRGAATGDPKGRYCASLGHKQDDESGLTYMRARYYEPTSGRFGVLPRIRSIENFTF